MHTILQHMLVMIAMHTSSVQPITYMAVMYTTLLTRHMQSYSLSTMDLDMPTSFSLVTGGLLDALTSSSSSARDGSSSGSSDGSIAEVGHLPCTCGEVVYKLYLYLQLFYFYHFVYLDSTVCHAYVFL